MAIIKIRNAAIDLDAAEIPNLPATKITSGTLDNARISLDAAEIPNLDTAKITTGTLADARVPNLNASKITAGTIATARLGSGTANSSTFLRGDNTFAAAGGANTPYFWGRNASVQAVSDNTATKLNATTERVDSDGKYASSRFTPTVAGNYFIFGGGYLNSEGNSNLEIAQIMIYKNGSAISGAFAEINFRSNPVNQGVFQISTIIDMDSDDYVELYGQIEASDSSGGVSAAGTFFGGYKLI